MSASRIGRPIELVIEPHVKGRGLGRNDPPPAALIIMDERAIPDDGVSTCPPSLRGGGRGLHRMNSKGFGLKIFSARPIAQGYSRVHAT
jgi:hypothetical protein